jgi:hypothetical protein
MPDTIQRLPPAPIQPPGDLPANVPTVQQAKHPCRYSILGLMHTIADLQKLVKDHPELSPEMKAVVASELASKTTNAAQVDLHVVDHSNGDSSIHIHVKQVKLG